MAVSALYRRRPIPVLLTTAFAVSLAVTAAFWAGFVPGVPKTLPTFAKLLMATIGLLVGTVAAWGVSLLVD
ncbi:hypothetical protein [Halorussus halophilus]|uniref:hypothetical protein n=1 Tax=Halorussus halophilus TaxID=2650975 RepID=UPI00130170FD|nr:hypothetical protein [Halorussus halophilus]